MAERRARAKRAVTKGSVRASWLPKPSPAAPRPPKRPWWPPLLREAGRKPTGLWYLLVEELVGDAAAPRLPRDPVAAFELTGALPARRPDADAILGIRLSEWPGAGRGNLPIFGDPEEEREIAAAYPRFQRRLNRVRTVPGGPAYGRGARAALKQRPVEIGDVFAAVIDEERLSEAIALDAPADPGWLVEAIDITPDARNVTREAFYDAVTPPLNAAAKREITDTLKEQ